MKKTLKLLLVGLMIAALGTALVACGNSGGKDGVDANILAGDTLRVGMECDYAPFNWTQSDDSNGAVAIESGYYAAGYDVEIAKRIAEDMGKQLVIIKTPWDGLPPALQSGVIDMIIAGMSPTEKRKQTIDFSDNYYRSDLVIVVKKDSPYVNATSIKDFSGAKLTAQLNTFHYTVISQIEGVDMRPAMDNFAAMRVALDSGIVDGYISERPEAVSASAAIDSFTYVAFDEANGFQVSDDDVAIAVGLRPGSVLADPINAALAKLSEENRVEIMNQAIINQPLNVEGEEVGTEDPTTDEAANADQDLNADEGAAPEDVPGTEAGADAEEEPALTAGDENQEEDKTSAEE